MKSIIILLMLISGYTDNINSQYFVVDGISMEPTLKANDRLIIDSSYYENNKFERGDIIVFMASNGLTYVKRVIGLPGDKVKIKNNKVYINGRELKESYIMAEIYMEEKNGKIYDQDLSEVEVPLNTIFVLGDNRKNSRDSRHFGSISMNNVIGKVIRIKSQ